MKPSTAVVPVAVSRVTTPMHKRKGNDVDDGDEEMQDGRSKRKAPGSETGRTGK